MTRPWKSVDHIETDEGVLELRQRDTDEFLITLSGRVLMNSAASLSEVALGRSACTEIADRAEPRVLVGGLGMGFTLRAVLDALPEAAQIRVSELNPAVLEWCRGPLAALNRHAVDDPRVEVALEDVADAITAAARQGAARFDAILLDLYEGPHPASRSATPPGEHPHYGAGALARCRAALGANGVLAIWSEDPDAVFERDLTRAGFAVRRERPGRGGRRHAVYLARARPGR